MKLPKLSKILPAIVFLLILITCKDREITNPFDAACPKEVFTPSDFKAEQKGADVQLSWKQANTNITGFVINRNENDGAMAEVARIDKSFTLWSDENIGADKKYGYQLFAYAGENLSNMLAAYCTPVNKTVVVTDVVSAITSSSAVFGGNATNDNGLDITGRGVCYGTSLNPTTTDSKAEMGSGSGAFSLSITGLKAGMTYYARAYAITKQGTSYGSQVTFTTNFLTVSPGSYTLPKESGSQALTVSSNIDWQVVSNQSWCTLSATSGKANGSVTITITGNTEVPQRTATITFTGTGVASQTVTITQAGTEPPALTITPENQNVTSTAGTTTFAITSNVSWTATSDQSWCTITNTSGTGNATLTVNYEANATNAQRIANLSVTGLGLSAKTVTVTQQSAIPTNGLVAYYPFNGNANDESGNGNNGTVNGATLIADRKGIAGKAYLFNGSNNITTNLKPSNVFSISIWFSTEGQNQGNNRGVFSTYSGGFSYYGIYYVAHPTGAYIRCDNNSLESFTDNKLSWQHLVIVSNGTKVLVYSDNVKKLEFAATTSHSSNIVFGDSKYNERYFIGKIDDIRIYNRALTETEILQLYNE